MVKSQTLYGSLAFFVGAIGGVGFIIILRNILVAFALLLATSYSISDFCPFIGGFSPFISWFGVFIGGFCAFISGFHKFISILP
ncbi:hypothetical protein LC065_01390 [Halobacillus litoralis]|uniref:hypothetical protein n=1 Tax=Halobacillus litoralis TaxID=45668 RepID=UPI001CFDD95B|nr:hypothetical protein [Halobacillus litoralis]WLR47976.1 hypothetical protein LC065_01390 [Halobacillus litoralis]